MYNRENWIMPVYYRPRLIESEGLNSHLNQVGKQTCLMRYQNHQNEMKDPECSQSMFYFMEPIVLSSFLFSFSSLPSNTFLPCSLFFFTPSFLPFFHFSLFKTSIFFDLFWDLHYCFLRLFLSLPLNPPDYKYHLEKQCHKSVDYCELIMRKF